MKVSPGTTALPAVKSWKSVGTKAVAERRASFDSLATLLTVPGAPVSVDPAPPEEHWRSAKLRVNYPGAFLSDLDPLLRPFVLLEIGDARVTPFVACDLTSFVHQELESQGQSADFTDNRPLAVRCVHPLVTLLEKLDALSRRVPLENVEPPTFVRHVEDAARIVQAAATLPVLADFADARALADDLVAKKQIGAIPRSLDRAFALEPGARTDAIRSAYEAISPMYWGPRMRLDDACAVIRGWIAQFLE